MKTLGWILFFGPLVIVLVGVAYTLYTMLSDLQDREDFFSVFIIPIIGVSFAASIVLGAYLLGFI